ncbi:MAG: RNase adapter RapZ, partial [Actinomycetales bacterium]
MSDFVVIAGLSGAGRSQAADILEDLGFFVIDNLPPSLIPKVAELAQAPGSTYVNVVLVVGTGPYHAEVLPALSSLRRQGHRLRIVYLEAATDVLVRRYESTRRRHPLASGERSLAESIEVERDLHAGRRSIRREQTDHARAQLMDIEVGGVDDHIGLGPHGAEQ